ncbi:MAG: terpene cyclase/mutase family protein, partial [Planctomycetaceae bacterium]|nr:terpene cyclase/mutase family protein [Planctomycetaceae bacterium]
MPDFPSSRSRVLSSLVAAFLVASLLAGSRTGQAQDPGTMKARGIAFLRLTQGENGAWPSPDTVGITGLVVNALTESGLSVDDPLAARALSFLVAQQKEDGGIYSEGSRHQNYETCISVVALAAANADGRYQATIRKAERYLRDLQWDEGEGIESSDGAYGGGGYDSKQRPDMSNTQFLIEALKSAGAGEDDPAIQKALIFVSRAQNLESTHNTLPYAGKVNDGGFIYTPARGGESKAGTTDNGGHRSYGSITYAGLKSLIYAGLTREDPRVIAATKWIKANYTLSENPGMGQQGLFYYYHTFARTMSVLEVDSFTDAEGRQHDWRKELLTVLQQKQDGNGSWKNP